MMRWRVGVSRYKGAPIPRTNLIGRGCGVPAGWPDRGGSIARARPTPAQSVEHQQWLSRWGLHFVTLILAAVDPRSHRDAGHGDRLGAVQQL
jgi:hypothetical protein